MNETTPNAADLVYARVKQRILQGDLEGGRMLSEGELAAEHGVSRTPVREAFLRLQAEGWMRLYPKRGALVVESTPGEIAQVLEARRLLENYAVQRTVRDEHTRQDLAAELAGAVDAQRRAAQADDTEAFVSADADFHNAIIRSAGNTLLTTFAEGLRQRQQRVTATSIRTPERMTAVVARHERLAAAIAAGDADAFRTTLDAHFEAAHGVRAGTSPADQTAGAAR